MIKVLVAESQRMMADALRGALKQVEDFVVLDENPASGLDAVEAVVDSAPDVMLLDYWNRKDPGGR